jgi:hypothetical protein
MQFTAHEFAKNVLSHECKSWGVAANAGNEIDCLGFEEALIILNTGVAGGELNVKVQECADSGGSFADVAGATFAEVTSANDVASYCGRLELSKRKRYMKIIGTVTTGACLFAVEVVLMKPKYAPAVPVNTLAFSL